MKNEGCFLSIFVEKNPVILKQYKRDEGMGLIF